MVPESRRVPDRSRTNATGNAETDLSRLRRVLHPENNSSACFASCFNKTTKAEYDWSSTNKSAYYPSVVGISFCSSFPKIETHHTKTSSLFALSLYLSVWRMMMRNGIAESFFKSARRCWKASNNPIPRFRRGGGPFPEGGGGGLLAVDGAPLVPFLAACGGGLRLARFFPSFLIFTAAKTFLAIRCNDFFRSNPFLGGFLGGGGTPLPPGFLEDLILCVRIRLFCALFSLLAAISHWSCL